MSDEPKKKFIYAPFEGMQSEAQALPAPIWPGLNENSESAHRMRRAKAVNDTTFWPIMREILAGDAKTLPMHRFKVWASVLTVPLVSRYRFKDYIVPVLQWAGTDEARWDLLKDPGVGALPEDLALLNIFDDFPTTMNRVQMFAHLLKTGWIDRVEGLGSIIEFGAGIGEMTDVIYKLGFKGSYTIYDFPELHTIQSYHHGQLGLKDVTYLTEEHLDGDVPLKYDLGVATFSITEMPMDLRLKLLTNINCDNWLVSYSKQIFGYDNDAWMREVFAPRFKEHEITFFDQPWHKWDGGGAYCVVRKK